MSPLYRFARAFVYSVGRVFGGLTVEGRENVPPEGSLLVASNHIGNFDPLIIASSFPREIGFAAKRELFRVPVLGPLITTLNSIPVDRAGVTVATIRAFGRWFEAEKALLYFPEGTRSRTGRLGKPKVGIGMILARYPVTVVPVVVEGTDSLVRCLFRRERLRVVFGPPFTLPGEIEVTSGSRREKYRRVAEVVMDHIERLKEGRTTTDDRETDRPAGEAARPASSGHAASGRRDSNTNEGMDKRE